MPRRGSTITASDRQATEPATAPAGVEELAATAGRHSLISRLLKAIGQAWIVDEKPAPSEAIVVLAGDSVLGGRLRRAAGLYQEGRAPLVILSGAPLRINFSEAEILEREALRLELPAHAVLPVRHRGMSTLAEAQALCQFLSERGLRRILVVTSNFHTRRARMIYRSLSRRYGVSARLCAAEDFYFSPERWWQPRGGLGILVFELFRTVFAWWELRRVPHPSLPAGPMSLRPASAPPHGRRA